MGNKLIQFVDRLEESFMFIEKLSELDELILGEAEHYYKNQNRRKSKDEKYAEDFLDSEMEYVRPIL